MEIRKHKKKILKILLTLIVAVAIFVQNVGSSHCFVNAAESPYGKSYTLKHILSDYQYFIEDSADITAPHNVGALAVGGDTVIGNFGDGAIEDSYLGNILCAGNYNGSANSSYLKDNPNYVGYLGKNVYYKTAVSAPAYATKWTETVPYINFTEAFTDIKAESMSLANAGLVITTSDVKEIIIDGKKLNTIVIPFGPNDADTKNVTIPYNLYKSADVILISGLYESGINSFHESQYVINIMGTGPVDLATSYWNKQTGGKAIAFETTKGNYVWLQNQYSLKNMNGNIQTGQMNMNGTKLIWNMPEATEVSAHTMAGHIVAPNATTTVYSGNFEGSVISKNVVNTGAEGHFFPYSDVSPKPSGGVIVKDISLIKTFEDDGVSGLNSGAYFILYSDANCTIPVTSKIQATRATVTDDFTVTFHGAILTANTTYYIKEVTEPFGYIKSNNIYECKIDVDGNVTYRIYGSGDDFRSEVPTCQNLIEATTGPTVTPTVTPSKEPTATPSEEPTVTPSEEPTATPSEEPTATPSEEPTVTPSEEPTATPSEEPTVTPSKEPTITPSKEPTVTPSKAPTITPSTKPTAKPTPIVTPSALPTVKPSEEPTAKPSDISTAKPSDVPTTTITPSTSTVPTATITPIPKTTPIVTKTPAPPSADGIVIDKNTGEVIQKIPTKVIKEEDSSNTILIKSKDAILLNQPDGKRCTLDDISKLGFSSSENIEVVITPDGTIKFENVQNGTDKKITVTYDFGNGQKIIIGTIEVKVSSNGDVKVISQLIDPYGTLTDAATGKVIVGADVTLYYADTERNIQSGRTPNTVVQLPKIVGFEPNNNINPQVSDKSGSYAYMVYPDTDYYIVATKDGYEKYVSQTIPVEKKIVRFDIKMNKLDDKKQTIDKKDVNQTNNINTVNKLPQAGSTIDFTVLVSIGSILIILGITYKFRKKSMIK